MDFDILAATSPGKAQLVDIGQLLQEAMADDPVTPMKNLNRELDGFSNRIDALTYALYARTTISARGLTADTIAELNLGGSLEGLIGEITPDVAATVESIGAVITRLWMAIVKFAHNIISRLEELFLYIFSKRERQLRDLSALISSTGKLYKPYVNTSIEIPLIPQIDFMAGKDFVNRAIDLAARTTFDSAQLALGISISTGVETDAIPELAFRDTTFAAAGWVSAEKIVGAMKEIRSTILDLDKLRMAEKIVKAAMRAIIGEAKRVLGGQSVPDDETNANIAKLRSNTRIVVDHMHRTQTFALRLGGHAIVLGKYIQGKKD